MGLKNISKINFKKPLFWTGLLSISTFIFVYAYAPNMIVEIKNPLIELARGKFYDMALNTPKHTDKIIYTTRDNLKLTANIYRVDHAKANIILLHGIRSNKEQWAQEALWLNQKGYNAIALDLRAHGQSQGKYCSFGFYEKLDISDLIDFLQSQGFNQYFGIWGHSLGAAVSLQALATDKRLKFGIIESAYANFREISKDYSRYYLHFESDWLNDYLLEKAAEKAGFKIASVNPIDYCNQIDQPVLIIHGTNDQKINANNSKRIFVQIKSNDKKLIMVENAGHTNIHQIGQTAFLKQIEVFLNKQINLYQNTVHNDYNSSK